MSKTLPPEIIRLIVLYLKDDKKCLHSCLLVSRDWCRETVDLLWRQPFHFLYTCNKIYSSTSLQFTNNCCSKEKRQSQATNLLITYLSNNELVKGGNIMFNYLEFLNVLDFHELDSAIQDWAHWNQSNISYSTRLNFLNSKFNLINIFKFFLTYSPKLKSLSFDTKFTLHKINNNNPCSSLIKEKYYNLKIEIVNDLLIPETEGFFSNLTELVFTTKERKIKLFTFLSQICHNIQKLIVRIEFDFYSYAFSGYLNAELDSTLEAKQLASLIRSQHNLVYFELLDMYDGCTNIILESLRKTQYNSLKTLILDNVFISDNSTTLFHLKYLQNLQDLRFSNCNVTI